MSSVRFVFPTPRLEKLLRAPGGLTVAEALGRAEANLETLKPTCREELLALLARAEVVVEGLEAHPGDEGLAALYAIVVRGIGAGAVCDAPNVDGALESFCDLIDTLQVTGRRDVEPLGVHVRAWRLLMDPSLPQPGGAAILGGLRKVTARYAQSPAP